MKGHLNILEEEVPKILTQPESLRPERKKIEEDMLESRILVISPYGQLNVFFESEIPRLQRRCYVEVVDRAELDKDPYVNVEKREKNRQTPYLIIDFQKIIAPVEKIITNKAKRTQKRRQALIDLLNHFAALTGAGKIVDSSMYTLESKPIDFKRKVTDIAQGLITYLDEKLQKVWEEIDKGVIEKKRSDGNRSIS